MKEFMSEYGSTILSAIGGMMVVSLIFFAVKFGVINQLFKYLLEGAM